MLKPAFAERDKKQTMIDLQAGGQYTAYRKQYREFKPAFAKTHKK
jgi:hypothetical protein